MFTSQKQQYKIVRLHLYSDDTHLFALQSASIDKDRPVLKISSTYLVFHCALHYAVDKQYDSVCNI